MFELKEITAETMTDREREGCKLLFDCIARQVKHRLKSEKKGPSFIIAAILKEQNTIPTNQDNLIKALKLLLTEVNKNWNITDKTKLIITIVNSGNEELIKFQPSKYQITKEEIRLTQSYDENIVRRNKAAQSHKKLKESLTI